MTGSCRRVRHDGDVTVIRRTFGPRPHDERAALTTARLAAGRLPTPPELWAPSPPGTTHHVDGRGIFVRHTRSATMTGGNVAAWYIHGLEGSSRNWDRLAAELSGVGDGFAVDLPGSGRSAPPRDGDYSLLGEADLVASAIRRQGSTPVHLVGNSRGGFVAALLAARHPELVRTLTLISPAVPDFRLIGERGADARLALVMLPGALRYVSRMLQTISPTDRARGLAATCFGEPEALSDQDLRAAADDFAEQRVLPWYATTTVESLRTLIRAQVRRGRWSFRAAARAVRVPTLVVWGTRDRMVDCRLAESTTAAFADARLLMLARTGHVAQIERPEEVARAVIALWQDEARAGADTGAPHPAAQRVVAT